jgi:hypothetical protein
MGCQPLRDSAASRRNSQLSAVATILRL